MSQNFQTVTLQPGSVRTMIPTYDLVDEKNEHNHPLGHNRSCEHCLSEESSPQNHSHHGHGDHGSCHNSRVKNFLLPIFLGLLALVACIALSSFIPDSWDILGSGVGEALIKRATGDNTNGNDVFTNRKLYLIVVFVGLFVVIILAIMLSAWCCKGAFQNPLCCPCYLCACCGGLACLECIGCGLCAEGLDQV